MKQMDRYGILGLQLECPNAFSKADIQKNIDHITDCIEWGMAQQFHYAHPAKLIVLPESSIQGFPFVDNKDFIDRDLLVRIPGPETEYFASLAKKYDCIICCGSWLEYDPDYPAQMFNTLVIVDETGVILKYRKVQTWTPGEGSTSALTVEGYNPSTYFPVVDTPLGKLGGQICYDMWFPEASRQLAFNGAEVIIRVSAYMYPWAGNAPLDQFTITSQARAFENVCYTVNVNQSTKIENTQSYQYSGDSCLVDYEGRILYQTTSNQGDNYLFGTIDLAALRAWRKATTHHMGIGHIRTEAYTYLDKPLFPVKTIKKDEMYSLAQALPLNEEARSRIGWDKY